MNARQPRPWQESLCNWLFAFAKGVLLLLAGVTVAFVLMVGYWWFATCVLLPTSRFGPAPTETQQAPRVGESQAAATLSSLSRTGPATTASAGGLWSRWREEMATTRDDVASRRGTFGDMFGASNAFFSALAFACVFYALILQRKDLRLQKQELEDTRLVAITAVRLQAHVSNIEAAFKTAHFQPGAMPEDLSGEIEASRKEVRTLLKKLDGMIP